MKSLVLHIPNPLRDALEEDFARNQFGHDTTQLRQIILENFLPSQGDEQTAPFRKKFREAVLDMQAGTGNPVLQIENLPSNHGKTFMRALATMLMQKAPFEGPLSSEKPSAAFDVSIAHHDHVVGDCLSNKTKMIQFLYCDKRGRFPQPTVFISADEIIDLMAQRRSEIPFTQAREQLVAALSDITLGEKNHPFLQRNPNNAGTDAANRPPEFIVYMAGKALDEEKSIRHGDVELYKEFSKTAAECVRRAAKYATTSTRSNTLLIWNDHLVLHARGQTLLGLPQRGRRLNWLEAGANADADSLPTLATNGIHTPVKTHELNGTPRFITNFER